MGNCDSHGVDFACCSHLGGQTYSIKRIRLPQMQRDVLPQMVESSNIGSYKWQSNFQMSSLRKKRFLPCFKKKGEGMMFVYYCITILANVIAAVVFYKNINITGLSIIPLVLIALMIFQGVLFKNEKVENGFRTVYGSNLTVDEENKRLSSVARFLFATIPWMIPFVIFFSSPVKVISILIYMIGLIGGLVLYKSKNKGSIISRMNTEEKERQEQEKREQLGKWK